MYIYNMMDSLIVLLIAFAYAAVDKFIDLYVKCKYDEWENNNGRNIRDRDGEELCFDCEPGFYFTVFRYRSEYQYPLPVWTMYYKTYGLTKATHGVMICGPLTPRQYP